VSVTRDLVLRRGEGPQTIVVGSTAICGLYVAARLITLIVFPDAFVGLT
jgi:hypothetical protein